jgi:hypothetical protein
MVEAQSPGGLVRKGTGLAERGTSGVKSPGYLVPGGMVEAQSPSGLVRKGTGLAKMGTGGVKSIDCFLSVETGKD